VAAKETREVSQKQIKKEEEKKVASWALEVSVKDIGTVDLRKVDGKI